jgi:hypothetical protein
MATLIPITVECHSGYKADEYPTCFYWNGHRYEILEITDRWYQGERDPAWPVSDYFKVHTGGEEHYIIKHDREKDEWFLCSEHRNHPA